MNQCDVKVTENAGGTPEQRGGTPEQRVVQIGIIARGDKCAR